MVISSKRAFMKRIELAKYYNYRTAHEHNPMIGLFCPILYIFRFHEHSVIEPSVWGFVNES